jgi:tetratricopeptide (TPR) repeat protein
MKKTPRLQSAQNLASAAARLSGGSFLPLALAVSAAGAWALHGRYYVGWFNDDASFVLLAQALWQALRSLSAAGLGGAFSHYLPGYPLFLAPFAAAFSPDWALLRWTTAGLTLLSVYGLWRLLEGWLDEGARRWAVLLYAVHPVALLCSGAVMADPFLACLFIWGLVGLRRVLEGGSAGPWALLLSAAVLAPVAKPIGLLLPLAITASLAAARARRALLCFSLLFWLPCLALALFALLKDRSPTDYLTYLLQGLAALAGQPPLERVYGLLHYFVLVCGLGWFGPLWDPAGAALIAGALYLCARGLAALLARPAPGRFLALAAAALLLGQFLVLSLWTVYSERYALPMLAPGLLLVVAGIGAVLKTRPRAGRALLAALAAGFAVHSARLAAETRSAAAPPETRLCAQTLEWIRRETPESSRFTGNTPLIRLYTGRAGAGLFAAHDLDQFLLELSRAGITHALVTGQPVLSARGSYRNDHALQKRLERGWLEGRPRYFKRVYANPDEVAAIYSVTVPPAREAAAQAYAPAVADLRAGNLPAAEKKLRQSLAADPEFPSALLALALVRLVSCREAAEGERLLRRALALEPNFPRASGALAQLLEKQGRSVEAGKAREAALAALAQTPFEAPAQ